MHVNKTVSLQGTMKMHKFLMRPPIFQRLCMRKSSSQGISSVTNTIQSYSRSKILKNQNELFSDHKSKIVAAAVPRIEKIQVEYKGRNISDDAVMLMNKNLSTPYQCALHISNHVAESSALALVKKSGLPEHEDGTVVSVRDTTDDNNESSLITVAEKPTAQWIPWDMHRPLEYDCEVKLLNFSMSQPNQWEMLEVNKAYWKSCALVLGAVAQEAFEDELTVKLAHLPNIPEESGAFCYDVELDGSLVGPDGSRRWEGDKSALISLTKTARHILAQNLQFERLVVHKEIAQEIFQHNKHQLKSIEEQTFYSLPPNEIPLYRFGQYIDICEGPLVPNTSMMYHYVVTAVHQLRRAGAGTCLWRFQGLSLPKKLQVHHAIWAMLEHRATKLVKEDLPFDILESAVPRAVEPLHKYRSIENETKQYNASTGQWLQDEWISSNDKIKIST